MADINLSGYNISGHEDPHARQWLKHLRKVDHVERRLLFNQARHEGHALFTPKEGVDLRLQYVKSNNSFILTKVKK